MEILNLISQGLATYNFKNHVASDIDASHNQFLPQENFNSQTLLNRIGDWTDSKLMKLNTEKSKYMIINFTDNYRFNSRLLLDDRLLEQVTETRLLGVVMNDQLTWQPNTDFITKKAYKRMIMLHKLFDFGLQMEDMLDIYILYIRSILESSAVVWHSSNNQAEICTQMIWQNEGSPTVPKL